MPGTVAVVPLQTLPDEVALREPGFRQLLHLRRVVDPRLHDLKQTSAIKRARKGDLLRDKLGLVSNTSVLHFIELLQSEPRQQQVRFGLVSRH